jgi:hypothetical protein
VPLTNSAEVCPEPHLQFPSPDDIPWHVVIVTTSRVGRNPPARISRPWVHVRAPDTVIRAGRAVLGPSGERRVDSLYSAADSVDGDRREVDADAVGEEGSRCEDADGHTSSAR